MADLSGFDFEQFSSEFKDSHPTWVEKVHELVVLVKQSTRPYRAHYLDKTTEYQLDIKCMLLNKSFREFGCYMVGSALHRIDFRDIDIRFILEDATYARLFHDPDPESTEEKVYLGLNQSRLEFMNFMISQWLGQGLTHPVDFQFQEQTAANKEFHHQMRNAMGIHFTSRF